MIFLLLLIFQCWYWSNRKSNRLWRAANFGKQEAAFTEINLQWEFKYINISVIKYWFIGYLFKTPELIEKLECNESSDYFLFKILRAHILPLTNCAFNKSGDKFITGSYDRTCKVWNTITGDELLTLEGHRNVVYAIAFNNPYGDKIITGSFGRKSHTCMYIHIYISSLFWIVVLPFCIVSASMLCKVHLIYFAHKHACIQIPFVNSSPEHPTLT